MPILRQASETVSPLARSRSTSRSNRATSSAVRRFFMGPSGAQSSERLPFQVDQFLGSRPPSITFSSRATGPLPVLLLGRAPQLVKVRLLVGQPVAVADPRQRLLRALDIFEGHRRTPTGRIPVDVLFMVGGHRGEQHRDDRGAAEPAQPPRRGTPDL